LNFEELNLNDSILKAVAEMGFSEPTPIQGEVIPMLLESKEDVIALAQTGTGKTAAFGLPLIHNIDLSDRKTQGVVLCPTRELCLQIHTEMTQFAKYSKGLRMTAVYGGSDIGSQIRSLKQGSQIIIATPGRLVDLIKRGVADLSSLGYLVMDEADIMLNMGFRDELDFILSSAPEERQNLLFSATMPKEVARIASEYMNDPAEVSMGKKNVGTDTIEHYYYLVHARDRYNALKRLVDFNPGIYGLVFCRTRADTQIIADRMLKDGYNVDALHGDLSQQQREYVMKKFRDQSLQLLVATDIAARGLDVNNLTHVIHYELPDEIEAYNHRSGRTGRAGRRGTSCAIINMRERYKIRRIEGILGRKILQAPVPMGPDICEQQLMHLIDRVHTVDIDEDQIAPYVDVIEDKLKDLDRQTLLKHFISLEFNRFLNYYGNAPDLKPVVPERGRERGGRDFGRDRHGDRQGGRRREGNIRYAHINMNLGHKDRITPPHIIGLINRSTKGAQVPIGRIDIGPTKSSVQVAADCLDMVEEALKRVPFAGKRIKISTHQGAPSSFDGGGRRGGERRYDRKGGGRRNGSGGKYGNSRRDSR
jgi:ATP-dependent RNA helicase DeaD